MPFGAVLAAVGGNLIGGALQGDAAKDAARIQAESADRATAQTAAQYAQNRADLEPWRAAGGSAVNRLATLMGLAPGDDSGSLTRKFTMDDFNNDPVNKASFDFGLSEGEKAVKRMFGARGLSRSGAAVKAATRFGIDYGNTKAGESRDRFVQDQSNLYNRYAGVAGTGQTAATNTATMGANAANSIGDMIVGTGNARGAAAIARGNGYGGAASGISSAISNYGINDAIRNRNNAANIPLVQESVPGQFSLSNPAYG